jgi:uncharacterized protein (UPF0264 family)
MTKLLVSVRSVAEAEAALAAGADLIDVKEPRHGALGMADAATLQQIANAIAGRAPLSAALGELHEGNHLPQSLAGRARYAKFGLAGAGHQADWNRQLHAAVDRLPAGVSPVAVAYADWRTAESPPPEHVLSEVLEAGYAGLLIDTFDKSGGGLLAHLSTGELSALTDRARSAGRLIVLAGKIGRDDLPTLLPLEPDYLGVRGAVCRGGRQSALDVTLARQFRALVQGRALAHAGGTKPE